MMRKNVYLRNILLAMVVGIASLAMLLCRVFLPGLVLPVWNIPALLGLVCLSLVLNAYLGTQGNYCWICSGLLAVVTFGLLPWSAGIVSTAAMWKIALLGGGVYLLANFLFDSLLERLSSGPAGKLAALVSGLVLFLAGQCFAGMLL